MSQYEITTTEDVFNDLDDQEDATIDYLWDGFIPRGSVTTFVGPKKERKSWLAIALAVSALAGAPLFDGFPCGGQRVMYVSGPGENQARENRRRLRGLARGHDIHITGNLRLITTPIALLRATDDRSFPAFLTEVATFGPDIIVLDSVSALWGGDDERNNTEVRRWFEERIEPLRAVRPMTVLMLAHTGKHVRAGRARFQPRDQRGASDWGAVADASIYVGNAPKAEHTSCADVDFARIGDLDPRTLRFAITGGGKAGPAIRFEAGWATAKVEKTAAQLLAQAVEAGVKLLAEGPVIRPVYLTRMAALGHGKDARLGSIEVFAGQEPWPVGPDKGQRVPRVCVVKATNPETGRTVDQYTWAAA